jgi:hypothetical protein
MTVVFIDTLLPRHYLDTTASIPAQVDLVHKHATKHHTYTKIFPVEAMLFPFTVAPFYVVLPLAFAAYWIIWIVYSRFLHPLSKYPGPFLASISRSWIVFQVAGARAEITQRELHAKYGTNTARCSLLLFC